MSRLRITGGNWRSRLITVARGASLRPTPDSVRETLFNWLGHNLAGCSALDLFAGSGILGLEAASRGAGPVIFVERERRAMAHLATQLALFAPLQGGPASPALQAVCADALHFAPPQPADLLFLDPPYHHDLLNRLLPRLPWLVKPDGRIYAEAEQRIDTLGDWRVVKAGHAGQVHFHLLEHA